MLSFELIPATLFPLALLFVAGLACFGIRRFEAPWWILAAIAFCILSYWGNQYLWDLVRFWSGEARMQKTIGVEVIPAILLVMFKHRSWIGVRGARQRFARAQGGINARR